MKKLYLLILIGLPLFAVAQLSNEAKALALIDAFETGDTTALDYISDDTYIQHNLAFPSGKAVLEGLITGSPTGFTATSVRVFSVGDFVILHNVYGGAWNGGTPQVAFDVFRFENGLIVEHWDNLQDEVDDMDGTTQTNGVLTPVTDSAATSANESLITTMAQNLFIDGLWSTYATYFDTTDAYVQHSVGAGPDATGILNIISNIPDGIGFYTSIEFVYVQGNFGLTMSQGPDIFGVDTVGTYAYYDLFRVDSGKIVEHWDVIQLIPPQDQWANPNGKWGSDAITSIDRELITDLRIYPNPAQDRVFIDTESWRGNYEVMIRDVMGRVIWKEENFMLPGQIELPSSLSPGVIFVEVIDSSKQLQLLRSKLIKE